MSRETSTSTTTVDVRGHCLFQWCELEEGGGGGGYYFFVIFSGSLDVVTASACAEHYMLMNDHERVLCVDQYITNYLSHTFTL